MGRSFHGRRTETQKGRAADMADEVMRKAAAPLETRRDGEPEKNWHRRPKQGVQKVLTSPYHAVYEPTVIHALL